MSACVTTIRTDKYDSKKLVIFPGWYKQLVEELSIEQPGHLYPQSSACVLFSLRTMLLGHQSLLPSPFYEFLWSAFHTLTFNFFLIILQVNFMSTHGLWDLWWIEPQLMFFFFFLNHPLNSKQCWLRSGSLETSVDWSGCIFRSFIPCFSSV